MHAPTPARVVMLGAAAETRRSMATVVGTYRAQGLFKRWPIDYLPTHGEGSPGAGARLALGAARGLAAAIARGPVAVHAHVEVRGFWRDAAFVAAALAGGSPVLLHLHGTGFERFYDQCDGLRRALVRGLLERAACVATPSESLRLWVRGIARRAHAVCVPHPVALEPLAPGGGRANLVLFLGHMARDNGVLDLLDALAAVRAEVPDLRLVCAGDGERIAVARYAESLGIADAVKFTGWIGPSGKRVLFESAAALAAPCYDAALPMSLIEAMAAGVPVVAAAVGAIPELVADGVSGFLTAPGDKASLARALRRLLVDRDLAARIGAAAREAVRLRHACERALPRLEGLYAAMGVQCLAAPTVQAAELGKAA
jgi:glycosyltransferase involved in cell wall biosynthesis